MQLDSPYINSYYSFIQYGLCSFTRSYIRWNFKVWTSHYIWFRNMLLSSIRPSITHTLTGFLYEIQAFKIWVTIWSNLTVQLDSPYLFISWYCLRVKHGLTGLYARWKLSKSEWYIIWARYKPIKSLVTLTTFQGHSLAKLTPICDFPLASSRNFISIIRPKFRT